MGIKVNIDPDLQHFYRCPDSIEVEGSTIGQCLNQVKHYFDTGKGSSNILAQFLDGTLIFLNKKSTYNPDEPVRDGDVIDIIVMPYGG